LNDHTIVPAKDLVTNQPRKWRNIITVGEDHGVHVQSDPEP
jgi:hypothetical protein